MNILKDTKTWAEWWKNRKIDWKASYQNWDHPHRGVIVEILRLFPWTSLIELGCGAGANLMRILKHLPGKQMGGIDISPEAIELAEKTFKHGMFKAGNMGDVMMSDKSTDVILTDMALIYVDKSNIDAQIEEIKRIARNNVVLCEFHSKSWWNRLALKWNSGYNAYDYFKLLAKHGFYDILSYKLTEEDWPGGNPQKTFGYVFTAKVPKR